MELKIFRWYLKPNYVMSLEFTNNSNLLNTNYLII